MFQLTRLTSHACRKARSPAAALYTAQTPQIQWNQKKQYSNLPFLTDEHRMISDMCANFSATQLVPIAGALDKEHKFPKEQVMALGELGMMGVCVSTDYGGSGMDTLSYAIAMEEISKGCASTGVIMSVNNSLYCGPVEKNGTPEQKEKFLTPVASGQVRVCVRETESNPHTEKEI